MQRSEWVSDLVIEEILRDFPAKIADRRRKLADDRWRVRHPELVRRLHDPECMRQVAATLRELADPFSYVNLSRQATELEWRMINTAPTYRYVLRDPDTGEVVDEERFTNDVDPADPRVRAYVAELN